MTVIVYRPPPSFKGGESVDDTVVVKQFDLDEVRVALRNAGYTIVPHYRIERVDASIRVDDVCLESAVIDLMEHAHRTARSGVAGQIHAKLKSYQTAQNYVHSTCFIIIASEDETKGMSSFPKDRYEPSR